MYFLQVNQQRSHDYHGGVTSSACVSAIARDIHHLKKTSQVPEGSSKHVVSSNNAQSNWYSKLLGLLRHVANVGIAPNISTYSSLINGYCKKKRIDEAIDIFQELPNKGLIPNVVTYKHYVARKQWIDERRRIEATYEGIYDVDTYDLPKRVV
ncbi:staphylococcal-like nuclease CAN2 [Tanacetum coccineum]